MVRKAEATSLNRISAFCKQVMYFYDKLGELIVKFKFTPNNMYNADETEIITIIDPEKVLAKGQRRVGAVTSG